MAEQQFVDYVIDPTEGVDIYDIKRWKESLTEKVKYFLPVWLPANYEKKFPSKPSKIFVNSMSDIYWWKDEWLKAVLERIRKYPQHDFLFLSKFPHRYDPTEYKYPSNCWLGLTIDKKVANNILNMQIYGLMNYLTDNIKFVSFEPLNFDPEIVFDYLDVDWIIIGAQTPPERKWIEKIIDFAKSFGIPVFTKNNLIRAYPDLVYKEFPEDRKLMIKKYVRENT